MNQTSLPFRIGFGALLGASIVSVAAAATLDVKTGLWEMTSVGETTGMPQIPPEALAKMTPEQRERVTAAMGRSNQPHVVRVCVTEKALQRGFNMKEPQQGDCSRTILTSTTRQIDVRL